jgi:hypothetical protein
MPLILAIDRDRRQGAALADLVRTRLRVELCQARSAADALAGLSGRIPDLVLTSPLLSARDEDLIANHLRDLGSAAGHVQTVRIPQLASSHTATGVGGMLARLGLNRNAAPPADACDPDIFAEEIAQYLARAAEERQTQPPAGGGSLIAEETLENQGGDAGAIDDIGEPERAAPGDSDEATFPLASVPPADTVAREPIYADGFERVDSAGDEHSIENGCEAREGAAPPVEHATAPPPALQSALDDSGPSPEDAANRSVTASCSPLPSGSCEDADAPRTEPSTASVTGEAAAYLESAESRPVAPDDACVADPAARLEPVTEFDGLWEPADWQVRSDASDAAGPDNQEFVLPAVSGALLLDTDAPLELHPRPASGAASVDLETPIAFDAGALLMEDAREPDVVQGGTIAVRHVQGPANQRGVLTTTAPPTPEGRVRAPAPVTDDATDDYVEVDLSPALDAPRGKPGDASVPAPATELAATPAAGRSHATGSDRNGTRPRDSATSAAARANAARQSDEKLDGYDPAECGFSALLDKLDEVTRQRSTSNGAGNIKTVTH